MKIVNTDPNHLDTFEATLRALIDAANANGDHAAATVDTVYWGEIHGLLGMMDHNSVELLHPDGDNAETVHIPILDITAVELT